MSFHAFDLKSAAALHVSCHSRAEAFGPDSSPNLPCYVQCTINMGLPDDMSTNSLNYHKIIFHFI